MLDHLVNPGAALAPRHAKQPAMVRGGIQQTLAAPDIFGRGTLPTVL